MAHDSDLPCDADGECMRCKLKPSEEDKLSCGTCATPWHVPCLSAPPQTLSSTLQWQCPDCSPPAVDPAARSSAAPSVAGGLIAAIRAIEADGSLSEAEKARKRQELMSGGGSDGSATPGQSGKKRKKSENDDVLQLLDESMNCSFCMQLPDRPVTTPCGHNFCLKCFQKWVSQGKRSCAKCRHPIPQKMASQPRINSALVVAIRMAKTAKSTTKSSPLKVYHFVHNQNRPDKAFTTERAKKSGKANACSGKIFVTVAPDHFGPILAENDPERKQGVLVGESWEDRMECRQWGAHLPHVAGIAGQADYGAQSVALSGGYEDDEDHGEWFLYTGSGGRDLSGNKRTNKEQSFDQKFDKSNEALRVSSKKGYPVRVVRSHKEKRSSYAPETGVRYDGIYRIEKCWRKVGIQGFKVCRYLFVRCDNEPAPWTSDEHGDRPRPLPIIKELKNATDITERKESPAWDYSEEHGWHWTNPPPVSRKQVNTLNPEDRKRARIAIRQAQNHSVRDRLLKEFNCQLCHEVMNLPLTTPCAHNFCKPCLEGKFAGMTFLRERTREGGRMLRAQKNVMKCPCCPNDISDFLQNPQVNRELMDIIESLKRKTMENIEAGENGDDSIEKSNTISDGETEAGPESDSDGENDDDSIEKSNTISDGETGTGPESDSDGENDDDSIEKSNTIGDNETEAGPRNPEITVPGDSDDEVLITGSKPAEVYKRKTRNGGCSLKTDVKAKDNNKSKEVRLENTEIPKSGDNDGVVPTPETRLTEMYKRKTRPQGCSPKANVNAKDNKKSEKVQLEIPEIPKSSDNDGEVPITESKPTETCKRKTRFWGCSYEANKKSEEMRPENSEVPASEDEDSEVCINKSTPTGPFKRQTRSGGCMSKTDLKVKDSKNSKVGTENPEMSKLSDKDGKVPTTESKPAEAFKRKTRNGGCSEKTDTKKAKSSKNSNAGTENPEMPKSSDKDGKVPKTESKPADAFKRKNRDGGSSEKTDAKKAKNSKNSKVELENPDTLKSSDKEGQFPITESNPTETSTQKTRNGNCLSKIGVEEAKNGKKFKVGSENPAMQKAGGVPITESKTIETYKRKTRSGTLLSVMDVKKADSSKKSKVEAVSGKSSSSVIYVVPDDDDFV